MQATQGLGFFKDNYLDHIGIAVHSIEKSDFFYKALGFKKSKVENVESEGVKTVFYETKNGANLELLEPLNVKSPLLKFLKKRGEGIHHIALRVKDLRATLKRLKDLGVRLINEEPRPGALGRKVAFIHPHSTSGVLYELIESQGEED